MRQRLTYLFRNSRKTECGAISSKPMEVRAAPFALLIACSVIVGAVLLAQTPAGPPPGAAKGKGKAKAPPAFRMEKGQPIDTRDSEKSDDKPAFAGQTRAPYEATAPFTATK